MPTTNSIQTSAASAPKERYAKLDKRFVDSPRMVDTRAHRRAFVRALADLLELFADVAESEGQVILDGGQWTVTSIKRGRDAPTAAPEGRRVGSVASDGEEVDCG